MFMVSEKCFCLPQHKFLTVIVDYKEIYYLNNMILHFFSKASYCGFSYQSTRQFLKLRGFDFILKPAVISKGVKNYIQLFGKH